MSILLAVVRRRPALAGAAVLLVAAMAVSYATLLVTSTWPERALATAIAALAAPGVIETVRRVRAEVRNVPKAGR